MGKRGYHRDFDWRHDAEEELGGGSIAEGHAGQVKVVQPVVRSRAYRKDGKSVGNEVAAQYYGVLHDGF